MLNSLFNDLPDEIFREDKPVTIAQAFSSFPTAKRFKTEGVLYLMMGWPGSGKSTYAKRFLPKAYRVEFDALHAMLTGEYKPQCSSIYHMIENAIIIALLEKGCDVVVDRTSITRKVRKRFVELALAIGAKIVLVDINTSIEQAMKWNLNQDRIDAKHYVGNDVYEKMAAQFELASEDEGFDEIKTIDMAEVTL